MARRKMGNSNAGRAAGRGRRLRLEPLEDRQMMAVTVTTLNDVLDPDDGVTSLREAIVASNLAGGADTIEFAPSLTSGAPATLTLTQGELKITDSLAIIGPGADLLTINANDPTPDQKNGDGSRVFNVNDSDGNQISVSISGLALTGGDVGPSDGGAIYSSENLTLARVTISGNSASGSTSADGGGIFTAGNLTIHSSLISNNSASGNGGGIRTSGSNLLVLVTDSTLSGNSAGIDGGGIFNLFSSVTVTNCTVEGNAVSGSNSDGGGIFSLGGMLSVSGSSISGNSATGQSSTGGGISSSSSTTIASSMIQNNMAQGGTNNDGGGIRSVGNLTIADSTISGNSALRDGGGIFHSSGNLSVSRSTIISNAAGRDGGAIRSSGGSLTMSDSTVSGNRAKGGDGGGIWRSGSLTVTNSTLDGNIAFSSGGGLWLFGSSLNTFSIGHSTIAANSASSSSGFGGGAFVVGGALILDHTILATNTARVGPDLTRLIDAVVNLRFSLIGNSASSGLVEAPVGSPNANGNLIGGPVKGTINPLLGPLANYGGPTQTRFLRHGSPALDAGDPSAAVGPEAVPAFDQRGEPFERIFDGDGEGGTRIDIGAYENRPLTFVVDTLADENNSDYSVGDFALREAISLANDSKNPEDDIITFANALTTGGPATIVLTHGELPVTASMRILGPGAERLVIDASGKDPTPEVNNGDGIRVFNIDDGLNAIPLEVSISGLTLTGGDVDDDGGAIRTLENLAVTDCTISDNHARIGGGIYGQTVTVTNSTISGNSASDIYTGGGGIYGSYVTVTNSTISGNSSVNGGGIYGGLYSYVTVTNSTISGNSCVGNGGGIFTYGSTTVTGSTISGNSKGGIAARDVIVTDSTISGNSSGSGIYSWYTVTVTNSTISGNSANFGGGIDGGIVTVTNSTISGNSAFDGNNWYGTGGGIWGHWVTVIDSTISGNSTNSVHPFYGRGGGIELAFSDSSLTLIGSTISGNSARSGGGIYTNSNLTGSRVTLVVDSTISGNTASERGGGIYNVDGLTSIRFSTITGNLAPAGGGSGVASYGDNNARTEILSTIVADNVGSDVDIVDGAVNVFQSNGYNLVGTGNAIGEFIEPGDRTGVIDPLLGPLTNNGGPTMTHALLPGSPAIDAGDPSAVAGVGSVSEFDQRGSPFGRVFDGDATGGGRIDIGAFEFTVTSDPSPVPWQNPAKAEDVNGNGMVSPVDALIVINEILFNGSHVLPASKPEGTPPFFLDVSGNGSVSPQDALIVINFLLRASNVASASPDQASATNANAGGWEVRDAAMAGLVMASAAASAKQSETATLTIAASSPDFPAAIATVTTPQTTSLLLSVASAPASPPQILTATTVADSIDRDDPTIGAARNQALLILLRQTDKGGADFALDASSLREIDNAFADDSFIDELLAIGWEDCR